jgi:ABC-type transporter Mla MlaB component
MAELQAPDRLGIDGALTLRTADEILQRLRSRLEGQQRLEIDLSGTTEIDVSGIQLILSARATARAAGKVVTVVQPLSAAAHAALQQGGFLPAGEADRKISFWLGGEA